MTPEVFVDGDAEAEVLFACGEGLLAGVAYRLGGVESGGGGEVGEDGFGGGVERRRGRLRGGLGRWLGKLGRGRIL